VSAAVLTRPASAQPSEAVPGARKQVALEALWPIWRQRIKRATTVERKLALAREWRALSGYAGDPAAAGREA
jgi:hypothetical protein